MRSPLPEKLERGRVAKGPHASDPAWGAYGKFFVRASKGEMLQIIASGADADDAMSEGWEHVSVSTARRTPNWEEMCFVKGLFWSDDETVIQFHPPRSEYVNQHPHCLHLWRHKDGHKLPPAIMVGVKDVNNPTPEEAQAMTNWSNP